MGDVGYIGVDGGGTGCRLALVRDDDHWATEGGPCNVSTDLAGALRELSAGLDRLAAQAGLDRGSLRGLPTCLGLAGVLAGHPRPDISDALRLTHATIVDDRAIALRGALGSRDGVLIGLGTGSFFAIQAYGQIRLAGGWGLTLGDEGSGAWLGREMLRFTLAAQDGLERPSDFTDALDTKFAGPPGIVAFAQKAKPKDYAALAPEIVAASEGGDQGAQEVMRRGRAHIVEALENLGWVPPMPICLTGGLADVYAGLLPKRFSDHIVSAEASALQGALAMARKTAV
ncbi:MAG: ATPase [Marinovum sp.]|nr:ATPase [Marinovum sp.]